MSSARESTDQRGAEDPAFDAVSRFRWRCSDGSNFGELFHCVLVIPADGGFPCSRRLRGEVVRAVVETGGIVGAAPGRGRDVECDSSQSISATPIRGQRLAETASHAFARHPAHSSTRASAGGAGVRTSRLTRRRPLALGRRVSEPRRGCDPTCDRRVSQMSIGPGAMRDGGPRRAVDKSGRQGLRR